MTTSPADRDLAAMLAEDDAVAGEVWQESDNVLLLCWKPGVSWRDFRGDLVPWDAPLIARPLRRLLDKDGNLVPAAATTARVAQLEADLAAAEARLRAVEVIEADHRREWADYIERWEGAVGPKPPSVRMIVALLRSPYPPFGCSAATPPQPAP